MSIASAGGDGVGGWEGVGAGVGGGGGAMPRHPHEIGPRRSARGPGTAGRVSRPNGQWVAWWVKPAPTKAVRPFRRTMPATPRRGGVDPPRPLIPTVLPGNPPCLTTVDNRNRARRGPTPTAFLAPVGPGATTHQGRRLGCWPINSLPLYRRSIDARRRSHHTARMTPSMRIPPCAAVCRRAVAGAIGMVVVAALAACQPLPRTPTPNPRFAPVTASPTASPSATATLTATAPPLPLDAPVVVGVPLVEADREVLSWLDPAREPRLEWSAYVRREALVRAGWTIAQDWMAGFVEERPIDHLSDPVIMVVVSTRGIDPILGIDEKGAPRAPGASQTLWLSPKRVGVAALFDAFTGGRLAAMPVCPEGFETDNCSWRSMAELHRLPTAPAQQAPALRITVTPLPTLAQGEAASAFPLSSLVATPTAAHHSDPTLGRLTWSTLPKDLHATFHFYGLAPGSNWTWRYVEQNGDVWWRTSLVTETIEAVWLEKDMAVVQSRVAVRKVSGPDVPEWTKSVPEPSIQLRFVSPDHISTDRGSVQNYVYEQSPSDFDALGVAKPSDFGLFGYASREEAIMGPTTLDLPFAVVKSCWEATVWLANAATSARWICPGIGVVQYSQGVGHTFVRSADVATLIRYHIAELPER